MSSSDEVLATIPVEAEPRWVAITPDGNRAYVTLTKDQPGDLPTLSGVAVIDTQTNTVAATITIDHRSNLDQPSGVVITPDGRRAYVSNFDGRGVVDVIDTAINTVIETITVSGRGGSSTGIAITPNGRDVYVATGNERDLPNEGKVSVIDTATNTVITTIRGNPFPSTVTSTPNGDFVYVLDDDGSPQVVDTATHKARLAEELEGVVSNGRIAFSPDGLHLYAVSEGSDLVQVLEVATGRIVAVVDVFGGHSTDVAISRDGRQVCVTQRPGKALRRPLWVIESTTHRVIGSSAEWSGTANGLAITPDGSTAYLADRDSRAVRVIPVQPQTA
jgi:YVTN family beta-propeller protein